MNRQTGSRLSDDVLEKINKLYKDIGHLNGKIEGLDAERKSKLLSLQNVIYGMDTDKRGSNKFAGSPPLPSAYRYTTSQPK